MTLPGETEAGSAGRQPSRGITWWAHRDDDRSVELSSSALLKTYIGSVDPDALKIPARRAESTPTENARFPFQAEPDQPRIEMDILAGPLYAPGRLTCRAGRRTQDEWNRAVEMFQH
jgi:hypothetical protein